MFSYHTIQLFPYLQCFIASKKENFGGGKENRTPDPLLAKQVLSQLSYTPIISYPIIFYQILYLSLSRRSFRTTCRYYYTSEKTTSEKPNRKFGGSGKTRTSDLTLIRRTL